jgi:hypothetical protein
MLFIRIKDGKDGKIGLVVIKKFKKAKYLARTLGIKGKKEWDLFCKQGKRPKNIPACPYSYYKEFVSYPDFFGYKRGWKTKNNRE